MLTFKVEIKLGNDFMQTPFHIADALKGVADQLQRGLSPTGGQIRDVCGNSVGEFYYHYSKDGKEGRT